MFSTAPCLFPSMQQFFEPTRVFRRRDLVHTGHWRWGLERDVHPVSGLVFSPCRLLPREPATAWSSHCHPQSSQCPVFPSMGDLKIPFKPRSKTTFFSLHKVASARYFVTVVQNATGIAGKQAGTPKKSRINLYGILTPPRQ